MDWLGLASAFLSFIFSQINAHIAQSTGGRQNNLFSFIGDKLLGAFNSLVQGGNPLGFLFGLPLALIGGISSAVGGLFNLFNSSASSSVSNIPISAQEILNIFTQGGQAVESALKDFFNWAVEQTKEEITNYHANLASLHEKASDSAFESLSDASIKLDDVFTSIKNELLPSTEYNLTSVDYFLKDLEIDLSKPVTDLELPIKDIFDMFTFSYTDTLDIVSEAFPVSYYTDKLYTSLEKNAIREALYLTEEELKEQIKTSYKVSTQAINELVEDLLKLQEGG